MPNWCSNSLQGKGLTKLNIFTKNELDFEKIVPSPVKKEDCPDEYLVGVGTEVKSYIELDKKRPWFNWYEFNCCEWGTKCNACDSYLEEDSDKVSFLTAWDIPSPIVKRISEMLGNIELTHKYSYEEDWEYDEENDEYFTTVYVDTWKNGKIIKQSEYKEEC